MKKIATGLAATALLGAAIGAPASALAGDYGKVKFGAKLTSEVQPSNSVPGLACDEMDPAALCTFVMNEAYGRPGQEKSPKKGKLKKIKMVAGEAGDYRVQLVKARYKNGHWEAKVKKNGPMIHVEGQEQYNWDNDDYKVEKFKIGMEIKKGWRIALQGYGTSAIRCSSGGDNTLIYKPQLHEGWGWQTATDDDGCYPLVEGVVKYRK